MSDSVLQHLRACRIDTAGGKLRTTQEDFCAVAEAALTVDVEGVESFTFLCTPCDEEALAAGFLLTEGLIDKPGDLLSVKRCPRDAHTMRVKIGGRSERIGDESRNLLISSSCGLCGAEVIEKRLRALPRVGDSLRLGAPALAAMMEDLSRAQELFPRCGATHAAAVFDAGGRRLAAAEDAGRHNALDKAIGKCLLGGIPTAGCAVALSGRVTVEMVGKCARAGLEIVAAISAPTALGLEVAERCGITVCAFVRQTRATVLTHPQRILGL